MAGKGKQSAVEFFGVVQPAVKAPAKQVAFIKEGVKDLDAGKSSDLDEVITQISNRYKLPEVDEVEI